MITNADMTLYSASPSVDGPTYTRHEIRGVNWQGKQRAAVSDHGLTAADSFRVFVPFTSARGAEPKKEDVIVRGIVPEQLGTGGISLKALLAKYPEAGVVLTAVKNDNGSRRMRHFELEAV
jgi:hypothetical protein